MKKIIRPVYGAVLSLALIGNAFAEPNLAPAPYVGPASGTKITWADVNSNDNPSTTTINEPDGMLLRYTRSNGKKANYYLFCLFCAPPATFDKKEYRKLFPLTVGNSVSFKRKWRNRTYQTNLVVLRTERIQTPSGTYDTFVVQRDERQVGGDWKGKAVFWYAPKVRWNVKYENSDNYGKSRARYVVKIVSP